MNNKTGIEKIIYDLGEIAGGALIGLALGGIGNFGLTSSLSRPGNTIGITKKNETRISTYGTATASLIRYGLHYNLIQGMITTPQDNELYIATNTINLIYYIGKHIYNKGQENALKQIKQLITKN